MRKDRELCDQGAEFGKKLTDFERMLEAFGYDENSWSQASGNERARVRWNWNNVSRGLK